MIHLFLIGDPPKQRDALRQAFATSPDFDLKEVGTNEAMATLSQATATGSGGWPDLLVLDLPHADEQGLPASLKLVHRIKTQAELRGVPLVLLGEEETLRALPQSREIHLCSLARKPSESAALDRMAHHFGEYWGRVARLPPHGDNPRSRDETHWPSRPGFIERNSERGASRRPIEILVVDDNNDDAILFQESFQALEHIKLTQILDDPEAAGDYLRRQGQFRDACFPDLVVLDIHMPRKTGLAFLEEIKAEPSLWKLPVVILTASRYEEDIWESYSRGACGFVEKPPRFEWFQQLAVHFANYWTEVAYLPTRSED